MHGEAAKALMLLAACGVGTPSSGVGVGWGEDWPANMTASHALHPDLMLRRPARPGGGGEGGGVLPGGSRALARAALPPPQSTHKTAIHAPGRQAGLW